MMIGEKLREEKRKQKMDKINLRERRNLVQEIGKEIKIKIKRSRRERKKEDHSHLHHQVKIIMLN
jgi:hypothetical protein